MGSGETLPEKEACTGGGDVERGKMPAASRSPQGLLEHGCRAAGRGREGSQLRLPHALAAPTLCNTAAASISLSYSCDHVNAVQIVPTKIHLNFP